MNDDYFAYKNTNGGSGGSGGSSGGGFISWQTVLILIAICIFLTLLGKCSV